MTADPRELTRLATALSDCAARLDQADGSTPEAERVQRLLRHVAADLTGHARTTRRLAEETELVERRGDARALRDLHRRGAHADSRLHRSIDDATRSLIPGGDALDPATILRRLSGAPTCAPRSYFGRPAVDRSDRVRRLTALLLRGGAPSSSASWADPRLPSVTVPSRATRIARIRRHLRAFTTPRPSSGARS